VFSLLGIKKSWNFAYALLGVPRPAQQLNKAHDILVSVYRFTVADLDMWNFRGQVRAKTLYNMLFIFYFSVSICYFLVIISFAKIQKFDE